MKHYCMIAKIKPEYQKDYIDIHINPWPELLEASKASGVEEEIVFFHEGQSIVFYRCRDDAPLDACLARQKLTEAVKKWDITIEPMLSSDFVFAEKVYDLNQQLGDGLKPD